MMAPAVHAEVLYEQDGIELRGTAQIVRNEVAICDAEIAFQTLRMKRRHGQLLHICREAAALRLLRNSRVRHRTVGAFGPSCWMKACISAHSARCIAS